MTIRIFLFALLLAFSASAQTLLPARQVSVWTNGWTAIAPTQATAQASFDAIDENWMLVDAAAFSSVPTNLVRAGDILSWMDANWDAVATNGWYVLSPTQLTAQATFNVLDSLLHGWGVSATNGLLRGTNIVGAVYDPATDSWTGLMPGTNIVGFTHDSTNNNWIPPFTNIVPRPGTNWSFTVVESNLTGYLDYVLYDPDPAAPASTNLVYDVRLGSTYSPMSEATAAPFDGSYVALTQWTATNSVNSSFAGAVAEKPNNTAFRILTNGMFQVSCGFQYGYGGYVEGVGAKLQVGGVDVDTDYSAYLSWSRPFSLAHGPVALSSGAVIQVVFTTPDGGSLNYSTFKLYYLGPEE